MSYITTIELFEDDREVEVFFDFYPGDPNPARFRSNGDIGDEPSSDSLEITGIFTCICGKSFDVSKHISDEQIEKLTADIYKDIQNARNNHD